MDVIVEVPDANAVLRNERIVVRGTGQKLLGLDFQSKAGRLSSDASANPFGFFLSATDEHVSLGALGPNNAVTLDGEVITPVRYPERTPPAISLLHGAIYMEIPST